MKSVSEYSEWTRLSPLAIVYFILKFTVTFVRQGMINILPGVGVFLVSVENKAFWLSVILPSLLLLMVLSGVLYYWFFKFRSNDQEILIHRGVFTKERLNLQFARVQNVNIATPFYFGPFSLVNCVIESAGSKSTEVNLPGVSELFALHMRDKVFSKASTSAEELTSVDAEATQGNVVAELKLSNWEAAKSGLTSYLAFIILAAFMPFMEQIGRFFRDNIFPSLVAVVEPVVGSTTLATFLIALFCFIAVIAIITSFSVLGAFIRFYNFELYNNDDKLVRVAGLLERRSTTLTKVKVQSVYIKQNIVARLLDRVTLGYRQIGSKLAKGKDSSIQIPMLIPDQVQRFVNIAFADCVEPKLAKIHPSYKRRMFFYFCFLPLALLLTFPVIFISKFFLLPALIMVPAFLLIRLRYRRFGFWYNQEYAAVRSGLLGQTTVIFPLYKIQLLKLRQSRGQRRLKVGNIRIQLGSGSITVPYVPMDKAEEFVNIALFQAESSQKPWI